MNLATPSSVQKLQTALHDKAKGSPSFRFYALYDKVYERTSWHLLTPVVKPMAERQEPMARPLKASRSTEWNGGWTNWRKN
jgi:hypothetical protein